MSSAQFATAFALRPNLLSWFLGAGASAASGIPTGYAMIRDFKAQIFCRENNLSKREIDTADPIWIERIDGFFRRTSLLPPDGDPTEYAAAFEAVYPQAKHRRQYIADAIAKGTPCFGHKVLGSLIAARKTDCVFTTNFEGFDLAAMRIVARSRLAIAEAGATGGGSEWRPAAPDAGHPL